MLDYASTIDEPVDLTGMLDPRTKEYQQAVRMTPATLAHYRTQGKWMPAKHLLYASAIIASEVRQGDARIILEMPPRHGKSELASVHTPIWFLDEWPHLNVILTTYASDLSTSFGRRVRDAFIEDNSTFLRARIREDVQRTSEFQTEEGGGMISVGIGGPITGKGGHLLIVDDYVKNFEEAMSVTTNEATWNWFLSTFYTRIEPGGSVIILATRWPSPDGDLIGKVMAKEPGMWKVIRFPAEAEANDPLGRAEGDPLWPEKGHTKARLVRTRSLLDNWIYSAMYQQDPKPLKGMSINIEMLRYVDKIEHPLELRWVRSWDLAASDKSKKKSDYTVGTLMGTRGKPGSPFMQTYLAEQIREHWSPDEVEIGLRETAMSDGVEIPIVIEQEPGASGKAYAQHLATNILAGFTVIINPASASKLARAQPYIAAVNHGRVSLLKADWNKVHKDELKEFPGGKHDDTVDSADQGYNYLFQKMLLSPTWGRELGTQTLQRVQQPKTRKLVKGCVFGRSR